MPTEEMREERSKRVKRRKKTAFLLLLLLHSRSFASFVFFTLLLPFFFSLARKSSSSSFSSTGTLEHLPQPTTTFSFHTMGAGWRRFSERVSEFFEVTDFSVAIRQL